MLWHVIEDSRGKRKRPTQSLFSSFLFEVRQNSYGSPDQNSSVLSLSLSSSVSVPLSSPPSSHLHFHHLSFSLSLSLSCLPPFSLAVLLLAIGISAPGGDPWTRSPCSPAAITNPRCVTLAAAAAAAARRRGLSCLGRRHAENEGPGSRAFLGCRGIGQGGVVKNEIKNAGGQRDRAAIDFSDPGWKPKFQRDFESRFDLPHLKDVFPDAVPIPSTFCLRMRSPTEEFADGYPSDEKWHGYINNSDRVLLKVIHYSSPTSAGAECIDPDCSWVEQWVHRAGPREEIYFRPEEVKAAIVTCGGLCPGLNDVIRQIVITLEIYGVKKIVGIPFGYRGFGDEGLTEMPLSRKVVQNVHLSGGSLLGVSRGGPSIPEIVDTMEKRGINMLFVLGGNGTHAGANAIHNECRKRRLRVAVVGVPKTIDNDILLMDKTFGFDTAVEEAQRAINSAYIEAHSAYHGIGIVKLMGRSSGYIAMHASLASGQIDICLIPEVPFHLHGPHGVLRHLKYLIETKGSAVVCVAEGAGQNFLEKTNAKDASGNIVLSDIGVHIQQETKKYFREIGVPADVKYIDPTYMIRACRANASDGILCTVLGQNAVHGAFAGYSGITVGICNTHYVYFPIPEVIQYPRSVDPNSRMWHRCLTSTGQPDFI